MANRLIGVEIAPGNVRLAVLGQHRGAVTVIALEQRPYAEAGELPELIGSMVPGGIQLSDLVATALPAGEGYVRALQFPFRERRKILAAAPFELATRLPVAIEECQTALLTPRDHGDGSTLLAAAVPKAAVDTLLEPFERNRVPLQILDLMPHALTGGLGSALGTGILVCINEGEVTVSGIVDGQIADYRHFPLNSAELAPETAAQLLREMVAARHRLDGDPAPALLTGALATPQLLDQILARGIPAELFTMKLGHREISTAFVPAAALALRAAGKGDERSFNLRRGAYAYRGEAAALKRSFYALAGLLGLSLLIFCAATALDYREKQQRANLLLQQMVLQYREAFPGSAITVDIPLQMQSKLQELRNRAAALGIDSQPQSLAILKELSAVAARTPFEVEELSCDEGACSVTGSTDSFDAVNRIKEQLGAAPLFGTVEVAETRKGVDGSTVDFRLRLPLAGGKGGQ